MAEAIGEKIKADFINEPDYFNLMVEIPGNTQAKVSLPLKGEDFELKVDKVIWKDYTILDGPGDN